MRRRNAMHAMMPAPDLVGERVRAGWSDWCSAFDTPSRRLHRPRPAQVLLVVQPGSRKCTWVFYHARQDVETRQSTVSPASACDRSPATRMRPPAIRDRRALAVLIERRCPPENQVVVSWPFLSAALVTRRPAPYVPPRRLASPAQHIQSINTAHEGSASFRSRRWSRSRATTPQFLNGARHLRSRQDGSGRAPLHRLLTPQRQDHRRFHRGGGGARRRRRLLSGLPARARPAAVERLNFYKAARQGRDRGFIRTLGVLAIWDGGAETEYGLCYPDRGCPVPGRALHAAAGISRQGGNPTSQPRWSSGQYEAHRACARRPARRHRLHLWRRLPRTRPTWTAPGVDFRQGLLIGQEVVSRIEHRGTRARA